RFITTKLKLKVNQQKSAVARPWERKFLGFSFTSGREPKRRIAPKAVGRFKERVRELTGLPRLRALRPRLPEIASPSPQIAAQVFCHPFDAHTPRPAHY
ncbi:MAG: hypothetical protein SGI92_21160, partial [Bryobacteraceae bacterium]|nr:hypothetical protein [Bryobacteraceae bacterium]